jgi:hypothetical protein
MDETRMKFFKKKFKTKRNHKVFDLAYFSSLTFISRLTHQLHTFLGFFDEYVDFGDKTFACGHYDVFFCLRVPCTILKDLTWFLTLFP